MMRWKVTMVWKEGWKPSEYFVEIQRFDAGGIYGKYTSHGLECGKGYFDFAHMDKMEKIA